MQNANESQNPSLGNKRLLTDHEETEKSKDKKKKRKKKDDGQSKEEKVEETVQTLQGKDGNQFTPMQYRIWAEMQRLSTKFR